MLETVTISMAWALDMWVWWWEDKIEEVGDAHFLHERGPVYQAKESLAFILQGMESSGKLSKGGDNQVCGLDALFAVWPMDWRGRDKRKRDQLKGYFSNLIEK